MKNTNQLIKKIADERIEEIHDCQKQLEDLINNKKILLYRDSEEDSMQPIDEDDSRWKKFCEKVFEIESKYMNPEDNKSTERKIIDELIKRNWAKEIIFIWHEKRLSDREYEKLFKGCMIFIKHLPNKKEEHIFVHNNKRWNKVRVHFLL